MEKNPLSTAFTADEMYVRMMSHYLVGRLGVKLSTSEWSSFLACVQYYLSSDYDFVFPFGDHKNKRAEVLSALSRNTTLDGLQCIQALALIDEIIDEWRASGKLPSFLKIN